MAPGYTNKLAGYPVFGVAVVKERTTTEGLSDTEGLPLGAVLVVGGGGAARTGVKNCISVYRIVENSKGLGEAQAIVTHDTGSEVCTSIDVSPSGKYVACSMGSNCGLFQYNKLKEKQDNDAEGEFQLLVKWKTDFPSTVPACQNVVKFGLNENMLATGGDDCQVKLWDVQAILNAIQKRQSGDKTVFEETLVEKVHCLAGHTKEIKDIDFEPSGKYLASASKDQGCRIWNIQTGKLLQLLPADTASGLTYRRCQFSSAHELITLQIPNGGRGSSYIVVWTMKEVEKGAVWTVSKVVHVSKGMATSFYLTRNEKYVGLATAGGSISLLDRATFSSLRTFNDVHNLPITGLCSTYSVEKESGRRLEKEYMLSGSIDRIVSVVPVQHSHLKW
eukprot:CAMPEP_0184016378 /NCGR_PEP_ID=MMETSP0954-20121128/6896_1 /TAXON_ID=627963 /ORGANISM="Aplanochytrium sp, Strain PBS07" /LENGTH=389 /DNA_ID=CAMNT_0026297393 /DNA_START=20 /DNA_END=1186 /DNA_ORIENTATION=+